MAKCKITITFEYDLKPDGYLKNSSFEEMSKIDEKIVQNHPDILSDILITMPYKVSSEVVYD